MKKILDFIKIIGFALGSVGGIGWSCYNHSYVVAVGCVILSILAFPEVKKSFNNLP